MAEGDRRENNEVTITFLIKKREPVFTYTVSVCALANTSHQLVSSVVRYVPISPPPPHPTAKRIPGNLQGF